MSLGSKLPADVGGAALWALITPYNLLWVTPVKSVNQIPTGAHLITDLQCGSYVYSSISHSSTDQKKGAWLGQ